MVLEVKNLSFKYSQKLILDKLSFSVPKNSITSILAPNGSGKTTLLKCLLGLLKPLEETEIKACNKDILPLKPYEKAKLIAYIPQVEYYAFKPPKQKSQTSLVFGMNALVPLGTIKTL